MYPKVDNFYFLCLKRDWFICSRGPLQRLPVDLQQTRQTLRLLKRVRFILNNVTQESFDKYVELFQQLQISGREDLQRVAKLMYDKAVDEQGFSDLYAQMCAAITYIVINKVNSGEDGVLDFNTFRDYIIHFSQLELEYRTDSATATRQDQDDDIDADFKFRFRTEREDDETVSRGRALGNAKFVGELFNVGILSFDIIHRCVRYLLREPHELDFECACKLLETIGKTYSRRHKEAKQDYNQYVVQYFHRMAILLTHIELVQDLPKRVRYRFEDLVDLWRRKWKPRAVDLDSEFSDAEELGTEEDEDVPVRIAKIPNLWLHV